MSVWDDQNGKFGVRALVLAINKCLLNTECRQWGSPHIIRSAGGLTAVKSRSLTVKSLIQNAGCSGPFIGTSNSQLGPVWLAAPRENLSLNNGPVNY